MRKDGFSENTMEPIGRRLRNLAKHVNLENPNEAKEFVAKAPWLDNYKGNVINAYSHYTAFKGLSWKKSKYRRAFSIKKLPQESDIDLIISYTKTGNR
jgi:hypothetical protein